MKLNTFLAALTFSLSAGGSYGAPSNPQKTQGNVPGASTKNTGNDSSDPSYVVRSSNKIDFNEASIDGRMKAPDGFFLQGRKSQELNNLLKLRSNFRSELAGSSAAAETAPE